MSHHDVSPADKDQDICHSHHELHATQFIPPAHPEATASLLQNITSDGLPILASHMSGKARAILIEDQVGCLLFRLPRELRNVIYAYTIDREVPRGDWDDEHNCPKLSLLSATHFAPSN